MPNILFLGSGFVAGPCLDNLLKRKDNYITIACRTKATAVQLAKDHAQCNPVSLDASNQEMLEEQVKKHDLVISLIPYTLHAKVTGGAGSRSLIFAHFEFLLIYLGY